VIAPIGHRDAARRTAIAPGAEVRATVREDVLLLVTELVNHAVRDGGSPIWSRARGKAGPWGLFPVEQIADRWGVSRAGPGTCVWFEIEFER
jgi:hypothetical protein